MVKEITISSSRKGCWKGPRQSQGCLSGRPNRSHKIGQPITPGPTEQQAQGAAGDKEGQGDQEARGVDPPVNQDTSSVRNSEAVVFTENTGTKSQSTEDLSETDAVKGDQNGSDSETSDSGTNSSSSYHWETEQISGASAPERAGASHDTGRVNQSDYLSG